MPWSKCFKHKVEFDDECWECVLESRSKANYAADLTNQIIAERDREWGIALCSIDVAISANSVRHGAIKVTRDNEDLVEKLCEIAARQYGDSPDYGRTLGELFSEALRMSPEKTKS